MGEDLVGFGFPVAVIFTLIYWRYLKMSLWSSLMLALVGVVGILAVLAFQNARGGTNNSMSQYFERSTRDDIEFAALATMLLAMTGIGIAGRLYRAWVLDLATEKERQPNGAGIRAWLGVGNLFMGAVFVVMAYLGRGWNPVGTFALVLGVLLAYPVMNCVMKGAAVEGAAAADEALAEERRRVLAMVEAGKVSGEDGAELIGALGQRREMAAEGRGVFSGGKRLMMVGGLLVVVGFCLPWVTIRMDEGMRQAMQTMGNSIPVPPGYENGSIPGPPAGYAQIQRMVATNFSMEMSKYGGDMEHGLGWLILLVGVALAVMPLVWVGNGGLKREYQRGVTLVGLVGGSVLVVYIVSRVLTSGPVEGLDVGLVVVMAGYVVMWVGAVREYVRIHPVGRAVVAG